MGGSQEIELSCKHRNPIYSTMDCTGSNAREIRKKDIKTMIRMKIVGRTHNGWDLPTMLEVTNDSILHLWVDYNKLDAVTSWDVYTISRIIKPMKRLRDAKILLARHANCSYWQNELDHECLDNSTLKSWNKLFRIPFTSFWPKNAIGTFQHSIHAILYTVKWQLPVVYLNDMITISYTQEDHIQHIWQVLTVLKDATFTLTCMNGGFSRRQRVIRNRWSDWDKYNFLTQ